MLKNRHYGVVRRCGVLAAAVATSALLLSACSTASAATTSPSSRSHNVRITDGGIASYSLPIGEDFTWIFPFENEANAEVWDQDPEDGSWRPLYDTGPGGTTGINYSASIAERPVYSDHNRKVTITLKRGWKWSDGLPVTTSDVQFFFQLADAGARLGDWSQVVPGELPHDIAKVQYTGPYTFVIDMTQSYNPAWFTGNQLTWITPVPRQTWDRDCLKCAVGNFAATAAGADRVYKFLYGQSSDLATYSSSPLWRTVDGPWVLKSYSPITFQAVFAANKHYTGPDKPHLAGYSIYSFNSDEAELDAVRSGTVDFGYLPFSDAAAAGSFKDSGFTVKPWRTFYNEVVEYGYTGPYRHLVDQLYIRQALQHLVNEKLYIKQALHGYGMLDYGVAPDYPGSNLVSPQLRRPTYPYSVEAARRLLFSHGWGKGPGGIDVCRRPGTGKGQCGPGIARGQKLQLLYLYSTGSASMLAEVQAFATAARSAGVAVNLAGKSVTTLFSEAGICPPGPCDFGLTGYADYTWPFGQYQTLPVGDGQFGKGSFWTGGYYNATAQRLMDAAHTEPGLNRLYASENALTDEDAALFWPVSDYEVLLVKSSLHGWEPLSAYGNPRPSHWYLSR